MLKGKKKLDAYVKLFELFERELKKHHFFFNVGGYEIRYIITTKVFDEKYNIEVTLYTKRYRKHSTFLRETKTITKGSKVLPTYLDLRTFKCSEALRELKSSMTPNTEAFLLEKE